MSFSDIINDKHQKQLEDYAELAEKTQEFCDTLKERFNDSVDDITGRFKGALDAAIEDIHDYKEEVHRLKQVLNQHNISHTSVEVL